jgi:arylsulfatase
MMKVLHPSTMSLSVIAVAVCVGVASAQQVTGVPGSPSATATISGKQLPPPDPKFGGVIKEKASESKAWWPQRVVPPKSAPNVLLISMGDVGFGAHSTFGGCGLFLSKGEFGLGRGKVVFLYNLPDLKRTTWEGPI